jgi:hypothetical protein
MTTADRLKREADLAARHVPTWDGFVESVFWCNPITRILRLLDELWS